MLVVTDLVEKDDRHLSSKRVSEEDAWKGTSMQSPCTVSYIASVAVILVELLQVPVHCLTLSESAGTTKNKGIFLSLKGDQLTAWHAGNVKKRCKGLLLQP